ncbi:MAG: hypothetical protein JJ916_04155 [Phycisphaerales bacterium]|nr:hypothetical protein [Phycisphaerales bacterium]
MNRPLPNGVYSAIVEARSREVASPAEEITYTVAVNVGSGPVRFPLVSPHPAKRWTNKMPLGPDGEIPMLYPFEIGEPVILHIQGTATRRQIFIGEGEVPAFGGCP